MSNDLMPIEELKPLEVFTAEGIESLLTKLETTARSFALDPSTVSGRNEIKSLAYKIARSKTAIDNMGKGITEEWKKQAKVIDGIRSTARDRLEALQEEIRRPVTEFEEREEKRIEAHEAKITTITLEGETIAAGWQSIPLETMQAQRDKLNGWADLDWQEFREGAEDALAKALGKIDAAIQRRRTHDDEQAELARLRQEKAQRDQQDREEQIRRDAAAKAEREAKEADERRQQQHRTAIGKMEAYRLPDSVKDSVSLVRALTGVNTIYDRDWEEFSAEAKALHREISNALHDRITAAEKREAEESAAAAKKREEERQAEDKRIADNAREEERKRQEQAAAEEKAAEDKRQADEEHRQKVIDGAVSGIISVCQIASLPILPETATNLVLRIIDGKIPHVSIKF